MSMLLLKHLQQQFERSLDPLAESLAGHVCHAVVLVLTARVTYGLPQRDSGQLTKAMNPM